MKIGIPKYKDISSVTKKGLLHIVCWVLCTFSMVFVYFFLDSAGFYNTFSRSIITSTILITLTLGLLLVVTTLLRKYTLDNTYSGSDGRFTSIVQSGRLVLFTLSIFPSLICIALWLMISGISLKYFALDILGVLNPVEADLPAFSQDSITALLYFAISIPVSIFGSITTFLYHYFFSAQNELEHWFKSASTTLLKWSFYCLLIIIIIPFLRAGFDVLGLT